MWILRCFGHCQYLSQVGVGSACRQTGEYGTELTAATVYGGSKAHTKQDYIVFQWLSVSPPPEMRIANLSTLTNGLSFGFQCNEFCSNLCNGQASGFYDIPYGGAVDMG